MSTSSRSDPRETYAMNLAARRASLAAAMRRHSSLGNLRLAIVAAAIAVGYFALARQVITAWWLVAPLAAFVVVGTRLDRASTARERNERAVAFYLRALARLDGRWAGTGGETGARFINDGHLYARDLDLFGEASLFKLISSARTGIGEETLAAWLNAPAPAAAIRARQEAVRELTPSLELREDFAVLGEAARTGVHADALAAWAERSPRLSSPNVPVWIWPLSALGFAAAFGFVVWLAASFAVLTLEPETLAAVRLYVSVMFAVCGSVAWRFRARTASVLADVSDAGRDLALLAGIIGRIEKERFISPRLSALRADLDTAGLPTSRRIARLDGLVHLLNSRENVIIRLSAPLVLWDIHLAYAIERWRRTSGPSVRQWLSAVGDIEALSSFAGYHYEHPDDVFPELDAGLPCFEAAGLAHPLIGDAVANDVRIVDTLRVLVVSGSNMSGKSTLLRAIGVNTVLAQAGAPVRARRLRLTPVEIGASIRIQDSLQEGVSRFYAEITRLGQIMRRAAEHPPVLFLIDELLNGTNSHDRRIGAEAIVRGLVDRGAIGLVTTHDLALAEIANAMGARAANVHFEDVIDRGEMRFDYRMRPGVVEHSNALALMRSIGLDV
jgi:hypothetical protein